MISTAYAKAHLRVELDDEDDLIDTLIESATSYIERRTGWTLTAPTEVEWHTVGCGNDTLWLHQPPANPGDLTVTATVDDTEVTAFEVRDRRVVRTDGVWVFGVKYRIDAEFGFATGAAPADLRQACALLVAGWYEHREAWATGAITVDHKHSVDQLLGGYERIRV